MPEELGVAAAGQPQPEGATVEQVVQALQDGAQPGQLLQMGVPQELIEQAMMLLQQAQQPQAPVQEASGLAGLV